MIDSGKNELSEDMDKIKHICLCPEELVIYGKCTPICGLLSGTVKVAKQGIE
jgi:hypothetical protein